MFVYRQQRRTTNSLCGSSANELCFQYLGDDCPVFIAEGTKCSVLLRHVTSFSWQKMVGMLPNAMM